MDITAEFTSGELNQYATLTDLANTEYAIGTINSNVSVLNSRLDELTLSYADISGTLGVTYGTSTYPELLLIDRVAGIEEEIANLKQVLVDIQMMLRTLGLDDMSKRTGDLNALFL